MTKQEQIRKQYLQLEFDNLNILNGETTEYSLTDYVTFERNIRNKLRDSFIDGYLAVYYLLGYDKPPLLDESTINDYVDRSITGKKIGDYIRKGYDRLINGNPEEIKKVITTETHRIFVDGQIVGGKKIEKDTGNTLYKKWDATLDEKTRETHFRLNGTIKPVGDYFETVNGKSLAPGGFGIAEEDCNCRCILEFLQYG